MVMAAKASTKTEEINIMIVTKMPEGKRELPAITQPALHITTPTAFSKGKISYPHWVNSLLLEHRI